MERIRFEELVAGAEQFLAEGNTDGAQRVLEYLLCYPVPQVARNQFSRIIDLLQCLATIGGQRLLSARFEYLNDLPYDSNRLLHAGSSLIDVGLYRLASGVLDLTFSLHPRKLPVLLELCTALERLGRLQEARSMLLTHTSLLTQSFMCRYLLAYYSLLLGDATSFYRTLSTLKPHGTDEGYLARRLRLMRSRLRAIRTISDVALEDFRLKHFVLTGSILMCPESNGARLTSPASYLEGIHRVVNTLTLWKERIPRVIACPGRESEILAYSLARALQIPFELWTNEAWQQPGVVVAHDLSVLKSGVLRKLARFRPDQFLWAHFHRGSECFPLTPDLVTYLYKAEETPWRRAPNEVEPAFSSAGFESAEGGSIEMIALRVLNAQRKVQSPADTEALSSLVKVAKSAPRGRGAIAFRGRGTRDKYLAPMAYTLV